MSGFKKNHNSRLLFFILFITSSLLCVVSTGLSQQVNHSYPRLGLFHWGGATADWYSRFDYLITASRNSNFVQSIKALNPDILVVHTEDWNRGAGTNGPSVWHVVNSSGQPVTCYSSDDRMYDITDFCPRDAGFNNQRYNEYLPYHVVNLTDLTVFDGVASDGTWDKPRGGATNDVDLDRNGVNDWDEHGEAWVKSHWRAGVNKVVLAIRDLMGNDKILHINSGQIHDFNQYETNGPTLEHFGSVYSWQYHKRVLGEWADRSMKPFTFLADGKGYSKDSFYHMRFLLGVTLLTGGYYSYSDIPSYEHHYDKYYDEFDLDLGQPTTDMHYLYATEGGEIGVWVRFFDRGAVIVNIDDIPNTVTDAQLRTVSGYAGPYYRFSGGQAPSMNNGQQFDTIELYGKNSNNAMVGDAILLTTSPQVVVSDIIIDNTDPGTSPGSQAVQFVGNWNQTNEDCGKAYTFGAAGHIGKYHIATAPGQGDANQAIFQPTIGVAGNYEVFEWHAFFGLNPDAVDEATDVPFDITFTNGQKASGVIDQSVNAGRWNSLGQYYFDKGTAGALVLSSSPTRLTIADAVKFVYRDGGTDETPPNPPANMGSGTVTESSITLTWNSPGAASDGDVPVSYRVSRDGLLVGTPIESVFVDGDLEENTIYTYRVYSVDDMGNLSSSYIENQYSTLADNVAPRLTGVQAVDLNTVHVIFNESMDVFSCESASNYSIGGISVTSASMLTGAENVVVLNTSTHTVGSSYTLSVSNVQDQSSIGNIIDPLYNSGQYEGVLGDTIIVKIAVDNEYEIYINGNYTGAGTRWEYAQTYKVPAVAGKNVIAVKAVDVGAQGGVVAEIDYNGQHYVSNTSWRVNTSEVTGWETIAYNDMGWTHTTSHGLHGVAEPWAQYRNVDGISTTDNVHWIWSSDYELDNTVYLRLTLLQDGDTEAPTAPAGVAVEQID